MPDFWRGYATQHIRAKRNKCECVALNYSLFDIHFSLNRNLAQLNFCLQGVIMNKFILASASPRRKELLETAGYQFDIIPSCCEEIVPAGLTPKDTVEGLAYQKALDVYADHPDSVVLGADTVVCFDGKILGKPESEEDAVRMLTMLSGQTHEVRTGIALLGKGIEFVSSEAAMVTFFQLSEEQIRNYVATGEPMDKAGAYGIQGKGAVLVRSVLGDYFNVVGLPIATVARALASLGIHGDVI